MAEGVHSDPGFWTMTSWIQFGYGMWVSMTMVGVGLALGFPAVTIPQLTDRNTKIHVTISDESWIASVLTLMAPIGCLLCGYLMDKFGRKIILLMCEVPMCVGWVYTGLATTAKDIIIGRIITGVGCGMAMSAPRIYITEMTLPNMRGLIGAFPNLAISIGLTLLAVFGAYLKWTTICFINGGFNLVIFLMNILLPESPYFILLKGSEANALTALKKFRAAEYKADKEINDMMEFKIENDIRRLRFIEVLQQLLTKASCKPFWFIFFYLLISQLSGVTILYMWTIDLLEASNSSINSNTGNVIMGTTRFLTGIFSSFLLFRIGRKPQALISSFGVGFTCIILGLYIHYVNLRNVVPLVCYVSYVIFATIGYYTIPLLMMYELYPLQVRGLLGGITVSLLNILIFSVNKIYPYLRSLIGHANIILSFGVSSLLGCIFLYFYLPETRGLTLQEIEEYFNDRRSTLVSQRRVLAAQLSRSSSKNVKGSEKSTIDKLQRSKSDLKNDLLQLNKKKKDGPSPSIVFADKVENIENKTQDPK